MTDRDPRLPLGPVAGPPPDRRPAPANAGPLDLGPPLPVPEHLVRRARMWPLHDQAPEHPLPLLAEAAAGADRLVRQVVDHVIAKTGPQVLAAHILHGPAAGCAVCDGYRRALLDTRPGWAPAPYPEDTPDA